MKTYLKLVILSFVLIFAGCDKEYNEEPVAVADADLYGSWELRHVLGIQIAGMSPDFPPGNGNIVKFENDTYQVYEKGKLVFSAAIKIESEKKDIDGTSYLIKFVYKISKFDTSNYFKISGKTLKICTGMTALDGTTNTYTKQ